MLPLLFALAASGANAQASNTTLSTEGWSNTTTHPSRGGNATCVSGTISVDANTTMNVDFTGFEVPTNQSSLTNTFLEFVTQGSEFATSIQGDMTDVSGTYEIGATLCVPQNDSAPERAIVATHGIGFDRYSWDFNADYSFVDSAAAEGYATLFYDRLGVGESAKPDGLSDVQAALQVGIASSLLQMVRNGDISAYTPSTVVGIGHSFGSVITQAITSQSPDLLDAAILTGFSMNTTALPVFLQGLNLEIASQNSPYRFAGLEDTYLVSSTAVSNQIAFFRAPEFDPAVLAMADAAKGTTTYGELFTTTAVVSPAMNFTGPVAVVNGDADLPFCFGNCSFPMNMAVAVGEMLYPNLSQNGTDAMFGDYLAPETGHGLNLHYTADAAYDYIFEFLGSRL